METVLVFLVPLVRVAVEFFHLSDLHVLSRFLSLFIDDKQRGLFSKNITCYHFSDILLAYENEQRTCAGKALSTEMH